MNPNIKLFRSAGQQNVKDVLIVLQIKNNKSVVALNRKISQNSSLTGREHEHQNQTQQV